MYVEKREYIKGEGLNDCKVRHGICKTKSQPKTQGRQRLNNCLIHLIGIQLLPEMDPTVLLSGRILEGVRPTRLQFTTPPKATSFQENIKIQK